MSKSRKKKTKHKALPLSAIDKASYVILFIVVISAAVLLLCLYGVVRNGIAFSDTDTVAYISSLSELFALPLAGYLVVSAGTGLLWSFENSKPIFGNKNVNYELYGNKNYPVFYKNKPKRRSMSRGRFMWLIWLFVCIAMLPLSFFGRSCLLSDNGIREYNCINQISRECKAEDITEITLVNAMYDSRYSHYWCFEIQLEMKDGSVYPFENGDFNGENNAALEKMLELKSLVPPEHVSIDIRDELDGTVDYLELDKDSEIMLYELFDENFDGK